MAEDAKFPVAPGDYIAGKYRVERLLGSGGMGVVFSAFHLQLHERVALKFLRSDVTREGEAVTRFVREARAAVRIRNDHVVRVMDVGTLDDGAPYLVMEHLEGRDLAAELALRGRFALTDVVDLLLQACEALAEAHSLGIVHRDLKPANLFLTQRANGSLWLKVMDFGISKVPLGVQEPAMTHTHAMLGSPTYMSPEQLRSPRDVDARSDLWALGAVLFQLLSGEPPFKGQTLSDLCINIATQDSPKLSALRPDLPREFDAVLDRCMAKEREQRFSNVAELALALAPFASRQGLSSLDHVVSVIKSSGASVSAPNGAASAAVSAPKVVPSATLTAWDQSSATSRRPRRLLALAAVTALALGSVTLYFNTKAPPALPTGPASTLTSPHSAVVAVAPPLDAAASVDSAAAPPRANAPASAAAPLGNGTPSAAAAATRPLRPKASRPAASAPTKPAVPPAKPSTTGSVFDSRRF